MWRTVCILEKVYLIKFQFKDGTMTMQLSDLEDFWEKKLITKEFISKFQELNPLLDAYELSTIVRHISSLVKDLPDDEIKMNKQENSIDLALKSKVDNVSINFRLLLNLLPRENVIKEVTIPLILTVQYLESCQSQLCDLLEKKDKQIEEAEIEFGELSRKSVVTEKFYRKAAFNGAPDNLLLNVFNKRNFMEKLSSKFGIKLPSIFSPANITSNIKRAFIPTYKPPLKKGAGVKFKLSETSKK